MAPKARVNDDTYTMNGSPIMTYLCFLDSWSLVLYAYMLVAYSGGTLDSVILAGGGEKESKDTMSHTVRSSRALRLTENTPSSADSPNDHGGLRLPLFVFSYCLPYEHHSCI